MYENFWAVVTNGGDIWLWAFILLGLCWVYLGLWIKQVPVRKKIKPFLLLVLPSVVLAMLLAYGLKIAFDIPRNCIMCPATGCNPYCESDPSFPSGHAALTFAAFTSLFLSVRRRWRPLLFIPPALVSVSRVALGVHTFPDIFAGAALGIAITLACRHALKAKGKL
jgi:undecaprenyl-diphosphatase